MLAIERKGHGPDLVFLHGWGLHGGVWSEFVAPLASRFRVHLVDLPGHGASPMLRPYTLEALAAACAECLPPVAHLCGWSLGGQVALRYALAHPQRVGRLVLVAATPRFVRTADWPHGVMAATLAQFAADLEREYEGTLHRFLSLQALSGEDAREVIGRLRRQIFARGRPAVEALQGGLTILRDTDLRAEVAGITRPTLVIHGERDTLTPPAAGRWLAEHLPAGRWCAVPGSAHAPFLSHPRQVQSAMEQFLDE